MISIMRTQRTLLEKIVFGFSVLLFGLLNLVPGLFTGGAYADAQYNGGGGGTSVCPSGCPGGAQACCSLATEACKTNSDGTKVCVTSTYYYYKN